MGGKAPLLTRMVARFLYGCQLCCQCKNKIELFSSDGVSILGLGLEKRLMTHLCESRSQLEIWGLVSVTSLLFSDFEIARTWLSKTSLIQRVFSRLYLQVRHNENRLKKCQIFEKNATWGVVTTFFFQFRRNPQILKSRVFVSDFKSLVSEFFMKPRPRRLQSRLHHCYLVLPMQNKYTTEIDLPHISFCV